MSTHHAQPPHVVVIARESRGSSSPKDIKAKNPQEPQSYLYDEENLCLLEAVKFADQYRSWFVDNLLCQEGRMNILTRVNPLFIFLPQLVKFASEQFRTVHDICQTFSSAPANSTFSRLDCALSPTIDWSKVCETREIDDELFVRFSESKSLDWLLAKHKQTVAALAKSQQQSAQTSRANLILEASDLIDQYLPACLSDKFKTLVRKDASASIIVAETHNSVTSQVGTKRTAPLAGSPASAVVGKSRAAAAAAPAMRQKASRPAEPAKAGGINNFFKPVTKPAS